jgi:hypothetical protein
MATTVSPFAATYRSWARTAPGGRGSETDDQARPSADSQAAGLAPAEPTAGLAPAEPTATNPLAVAVTAMS